MDNLRIVSVKVKDSTNIEAKFTHNLDSSIGINNITITPQASNVPTPIILKTKIVKDTLFITTQPLTPLGAYFIKFQTASGVIFKSINATAIIHDDGITNQQLILGPSENENIIKEFLRNYLRDSIYAESLDDSNTVVNKIIESIALLYSKALYDIRQLKNENYLSFTVTDETKTRGSGPFDRLFEEAAYNISRVAKTKTGSGSTLTFDFEEFPANPVTLLATTASENLEIDSEDNAGTFNINGFNLNVAHGNVSKLTEVVFSYSDRDDFTYPLETLGYQIQSSRYDQDFGFGYLILETNQFKLSENILSDTDFSTQNITRVAVTYEYRNLGRIIDPGSVQVTTILTAVREALPPIINVFNLKHAPILDEDGELPTIDGITFTDPNALDSTTPHASFLYELPFRFNRMPTAAGEFSIDYETGTVYVFGSDSTNNGTSPSPPLVTYNYELTYKTNVDYVYDEDLHDLVALPNGNLLLDAGTIEFNYEEVLIPGIDYNAHVHEEELDERIENKLLALNALKTQNSPITNVFRIFNETSGEIYSPLRWNDDKVYFTYNNPPSVKALVGERVSFEEILNEILFVNLTIVNGAVLNVYKCLLANNDIVAGSEDCIGSSINTSIKFSDPTVFVSEKWFDPFSTEVENTDRLLSVGEYQVDYANGVVYCAVESDQSNNIGTVNYKRSYIVPQHPHLISVDDIYNQISFLNPKDKTFDVGTFEEASIFMDALDSSDEGYLNEAEIAPYTVYNSIVGAYVNAVFIPGVTDTINFNRGIYEFSDLQNSTNPLNFAEAATFSGKVITLNPLEYQEYATVVSTDDGYTVELSLNLPYISSNFNFTVSVIRNSDLLELWDGSGTMTPGENLTLTLSGVNSPNDGDTVVVIYSIEIADLSRVIVDYNKGDLFVDYTYLADEIIISYEWGENAIDFRESLSISEGTPYYVTYKVGALRDALLKNFGSLVNIPELTTFDIDLSRESYRDALEAALESFIKGPTVVAIKNIVEKITHIEPEIIESVFQNWSLGSSYLNPRGIETEGEFSLLPAKYGNGVLVDTAGQTITLPVSSNLRLEKGTLEAWVLPSWNGIDNDAELTFSITRDGYAIDSNDIFIGAAEYHPELETDDTFTVNKLGDAVGIPSKNKDGIFIYYNDDPSGLFKRWYVDVVDGYSFGHVDGYETAYRFRINTDGLFYDVKSTVSPKPSNMKITSGTGVATITITETSAFDESFTFIADRNHYLFDFGEEVNENRFSIFKDPSGYLNFRIADKDRNVYSVSADISSWKSDEKHHVAASWALNSKIGRDELHLFVDGVETPNVIKYGNKLGAYLHEKFRTINPEQIAGVVTKNIVGSTDLVTTSGSDVVSSSVGFSGYDIVPGDTIFIDESGFDESGYTINDVNGNDLTLSATMPATLTDGRFSVNRTNLTVTTEIDIYPNIAVSTISFVLDGADLVATEDSDTVTSGTDFEAEGVLAGYILRIDDSMFEEVYFADHYLILNVDGNELTLNDTMPISLSDLAFYIYPSTDVEIPGVRALHPSYSLTKDEDFNNILTLSNDVSANDLIIINTLGVNHKRVRAKYYQWGDTDNVIKTSLPPPISLDEVDITHVILNTTVIKSTNSSLVSNSFTSDAFTTDQPSINNYGRTLSVAITSNDNLDFGVPVDVTISGTVDGNPGSEVVSFTEIGSQSTVGKFSEITDVVVTGDVFNTSRAYLTLAIKEAFPITIVEGDDSGATIKYSYQARAGTHLEGDTDTVTDGYVLFSHTDVGNYLVISSPVPGTYLITGVSDDLHSLTIDGSLSPFTSGIYQVLNTSSFRSGFQNGIFLLEETGAPGVPYPLSQGLYEFDFFTYLSAKIAPVNGLAYIGSDFSGENLFSGVIDELKIYSSLLTDLRIGETATVNEDYVTKDFNSLKELKANSNTLVLAHFDTFPFVNSADYYIMSEGKNFVQSDVGVNDNFSKSICITDKPFIIDNDGILNTKKEGTIEFWVNPLFDSANDPGYRFYFDAAGANIENVTSLDAVTLQLAGRASQILSVRLKNGDSKIDYFAGGSIEVGSSGAVAETTVSPSDSSVTVSRKILQVVNVKIVGDPMNTDYFNAGSISSDGRTIYLGTTLPSSGLELVVTYKPKDGVSQTLNNQVIRLKKKLPNNQTQVVVTYVPSGLHGDRLSIYKDPSGFINFNVRAEDIDYQVRAPIFWAKNSWHRIKATYNVNGGETNDEIRLFVDGYEHTNIIFGTGLLFGDPNVVGASYTGSSGIVADIKFKDLPNELFIGTDYAGQFGAQALIDNLRISNISRPVFSPFDESIDVNYNSNLEAVFPVTEDLYTTYLLDFETLLLKNEDFITLKNKNAGIFDFSINIFDSFGIVNNSTKVQEVLEKLIKILKPANSRVFLKYIR